MKKIIYAVVTVAMLSVLSCNDDSDDSISEWICPTGIVLLDDKVLLEPEGQSHFEFRVNPSNAKVDFVFDNETANLQLDLVNVRSAESYVNASENYRIVAVEPSTNAAGEELIGQYTVTIEDCGKSSNYVEKATLVLTTQDEKGNCSQFSSSLIEVSCGVIFSLSVEDFEVTRSAENVFHIKVPYGTDVTRLQPKFETNGVVRVKGKTMQETLVDFSNPVIFEVVGENKTAEYSAIVYYSDLPIIYINTPTTIVSKDVWMENCVIEIWNAGDENGIYEAVQMKGRGNTTWGQPKKPYAIKLKKKTEVLGLPKHKRWVLLANDFDKSSLRNEIAFYMGRISNLLYTPRSEFVEVVMNGEYAGLYQVTEQLKIDENRVDVGDDGFLLEIDSRAGEDPDDVYFRIPHIWAPIVIKDPDVEENDDSFNYIEQFMVKADDALFGENYMDAENGWRKYLDVESFVDWYLINEITRNNDAVFFSSCYMNLKRGGKLSMGPLWDFDLAIANTTMNNSDKPEGFWIKTVAWYSRLFTDAYFIDRVKDRFDYYYTNREKIYEELNRQNAIIDYAIIGNEWRWNKFGVQGDEEKIHECHANEVEAMRTWLETRFNWMKSEFDKM